MIEIITLLLILCLSVDVFLTGTVEGFLIKKPKIVEVLRLVAIPVIIPGIILISGFYFGNLAALVFNKNEALWFGATVLFILSLKQLYDGFRLNKLKKTINPLDKKGLIILSVFIGINAFFVGLALGFIDIDPNLIFRGITFFIFAIAMGLFIGKRLKKLISFRFELIVSLVYLITAIVIVVKL